MTRAYNEPGIDDAPPARPLSPVATWILVVAIAAVVLTIAVSPSSGGAANESASPPVVERIDVVSTNPSGILSGAADVARAVSEAGSTNPHSKYHITVSITEGGK